MVSIPAQSLDRSLFAIARTTGMQVVFSDPRIAQRQAVPLSGRFTAQAMLERVLANSGYTYELSQGRIIRVYEVPVAHAVPVRATTTPIQAAPGRQAETTTPAPEVPVPDIVVTGSRVGNANIATSLPVTLLDRDRIQSTGLVTTSELASTIPQMAGQGFNSSNQGPNNARGDVASPNLRGLGAGNTLALLDGRRLVANPGTQQEGSVPVQTVNINTIPGNAVGRVEVLRDGAGAIYGSDATAGVINFITDPKFTGLEVSGRYGGSQGTSLRESNLSAKYGVASKDGRTRFTLAADYYHLTAMPASERSYSASDNLSALVGPAYASYFDNRSTLTPWTSGTVKTPITGLGTSFTSFFVQPCSLANSRAPVTGSPGVCVNGGSTTLPSALRYDEAPQRSVTPRTTRYTLLSDFSHDFGDVEFFGQFLYYHGETLANRGGSTNLTTAPLIVGADNPYNPFGSGPGRLPGYTGPAQAVTLVGLRVDDVGPRWIDVKSDTGRILGGLRGTIGDNWKWETAGLYSWAKTDDEEHNRVSNTALEAALLSSNPATAYNPFTGGNLTSPSLLDPTLNPASVTDPMRITVHRISRTQLYLADAKLTNAHLLSLRGQDVGIAIGGEFRRETYFDDRDPRVDGTINYTSPNGVVTSDVLGTSPTLDTRGTRNVISGYAELAVPLISRADNIPLVKSLDLQVAGRFEHFYDIHDGVVKPKVSVGWQMTDWLKLRGTYSQGFRAPNLEVVNSSLISRVQQNLTDYYLCAKGQGVTSLAQLNKSACSAYRFDVVDNRSGSRDLKPETVESVSAGIVLTPLRRLTITADYWHIVQNSLIGIFSAQDHLNLDAVRRLGGGGTDPALLRSATTDQPLSVANTFLNLGKRTVSGIDVDVTYRTPETSIGSFSLTGDVAYLIRYYQDADTDSAALLANGLPASAGGSLIEVDDNPRFRASGSIAWRKSNWGANLFGYYVGPTQASTALYYPVSSWFVLNSSVSYAFDHGPLNGTSVRFGINNIADRDPPLTNATFGYNVALANDRGRFIYGQLTFRLK
ncbi:TonB-dependent receptor [Sphingomonas sp. CL5.1]|uniref:TonB-dependent receptor n=1 Tax=Sphingomonas sp. CL5.1 TaxID=2653203 RepID=UPI0015825CAD|nr:TonB-dependent receptor [Sphingomonas sp. CL5.1]QKR98368.1 TonB-dependent receptor [Sphingomonas sp. CL5.1]